MKQIVIALSLVFIFAISYIAFINNERKDAVEVKGTSSMEHSFFTMKDGQGSLGTVPDYSKVGGKKEGGATAPTAAQYKPTTSGVKDYTNIGSQKNPHLPTSKADSPEGTKNAAATTEEPNGAEKESPKKSNQSNLTTRQKHVELNGVPAKYKDIKSPFPLDEARVRAGMVLFNSRCKACHGLHGYGDGPVGASLSPKPSNLSEVVASNYASDGYLFWALTEGGSPLGSAMISLKTLPEENRWNIIHYLRAEIAKK